MNESAPAPTFEEAIARLETVVTRLESGDLTLEESLRCFEEGVALQRRCIADLSSAQGKIEQLLDEGAPSRVPAGFGGGIGAQRPLQGEEAAVTVSPGRTPAPDSL